MVAPVLGRGENRKISPWGMMKNSWRKTMVFIHRKLKLRLVDMKNHMIWDIWVVKAYPLFMLFCCCTNTIQWRNAIFYLTKVISMYVNDIWIYMNILYVKYIKHMWQVNMLYSFISHFVLRSDFNRYHKISHAETTPSGQNLDFAELGSIGLGFLEAS